MSAIGFFQTTIADTIRSYTQIESYSFPVASLTIFCNSPF